MTSTPREFTAPAMALRTSAILLIFVIIFTALLSGSLSVDPAGHRSLGARRKDEAAQRSPAGQQLRQRLAQRQYRIAADARAWAQGKQHPLSGPTGGADRGPDLRSAGQRWLCRPIKLLIALRADGSIAGVRVTQHKETPGLGDYIEPRKDKNKERPWISQFTGLSLTNTLEKAWRVKKDGGQHRLLRRCNSQPARHCQGSAQGHTVGKS
jgi:Na+-translocating ferredoxin:NAD+ oxidoreductase subunit G